MAPLISVVCLLFGTFIALTKTFLFVIGLMIEHSKVHHPEDV